MYRCTQRERRYGLLMVVVSVLLLAACDKKEAEPQGQETTPTTTEATQASTGTPTAEPTAAPVAPEPTAAPEVPAPAGQTFALAPNFVPITQNGRSGGNIDASTLYGSECLGNIASSPDHTFTVSEPVSAAFAVTSEADTTLVIVGPGGPFCNDDMLGLNPGLTAQLQPGSYQLFVGNYSTEEGPAAYTLMVTPTTIEVPTEIVVPPIEGLPPVPGTESSVIEVNVPEVPSVVVIPVPGEPEVPSVPQMP
ncbi:MAG: hypothetical protein JW797_00520 [Bradymonadales bacterium]|nr:hypothetical protein [Bradymonadales bacterium]